MPRPRGWFKSRSKLLFIKEKNALDGGRWAIGGDIPLKKP